ncbi:MAG TPA: hypothetical protein VG123_18745, partial [Streptosporangiaceae bacterium]|nr:hypothetical protein [Streptosporangiaceae bacterium]
MNRDICPGTPAAHAPGDRPDSGRSGITEPPRTVNGLPVIDWRPRPARPGELPGQSYVICLRPDDESGRPYIVWTIAYDPRYQGGSWVAGNGRYDLTWSRAQQVLDERAATSHLASTGASAGQPEASSAPDPSAPAPASRPAVT